MPKQDPKPETLPAPDANTAADEFHGQGGSYVIDPATGRRTRVEPPTVETGTHFQKE